MIHNNQSLLKLDIVLQKCHNLNVVYIFPSFHIRVTLCLSTLAARCTQVNLLKVQVNMRCSACRRCGGWCLFACSFWWHYNPRGGETKKSGLYCRQTWAWMSRATGHPRTSGYLDGNWGPHLGFVVEPQQSQTPGISHLEVYYSLKHYSISYTFIYWKFPQAFQ